MSLRARAFSIALIGLAAAMTGPLADAYESAARQAILVDVTGNRVLYEKNADQHMPTSSMSKMMTIYMVFDALKSGKIKLDDTLTVSERAWRTTYKQEESSMFLPIGTQVRVEDLIRGVIIQSGNDATVVLAEGLGGSEAEFVTEMNDKAKQLGMNDSHFVNSNGMPDPEHYSTARDLATLATHLNADFPEYYHYFGELEFTYNKIKQGNRNPLLYRNGLGVDGLKTGHTDAGGYGLTASAQRNGRRLVAVVNGLPNMQARADDPAALIDYGFNEFKNYPVFKSGETIEQAETWEGVTPTVPLIIDQPVSLTLSFAERKGLKAVVSIPRATKAPISAGQTIGKLIISAPNISDMEIPLKAANAVARLGFMSRIGMVIGYLMSGHTDTTQTK